VAWLALLLPRGELNVAPQHAAAHYNLAQLYDELADRGAAVRARIAALSRIPE